MMALGILVGVCAIFVLLIVDDRRKREDGLPVSEREMVEDFTDWACWDWPDGEPHWRWRS